ncbi:MAG TPA: hypothetical protein VK930_15460 [Verrucomicrobiae bacterium]|jgi:hypothetical protein|nr:hypothetical protein [Verrucomicrobiae bacterium]
MTSSQPSSPQPSVPAPDLATIWSSARRLHPIYAEMAREFVVDIPGCSDLEAHVDTPGRESVEQAQQWLNAMDDKIQVHQLRQFLQTSSLVDADGLIALLTHFLGKTPRSDSGRDKIDFLMVQYFSQGAPSELDDSNADVSYVAQALEPILGKVELKTPVWLNALDRVLDSARRCRSLDELLHGGVLEQGRKAKAQAGDLYYLPIALIAFTRFGYLMRRAFFRLMLADLNNILDGLTELEEKGVETIDCRRAQFSDKEPIIRLRMICQSWKVMFQAEYSSGQPLRMLVDLRASVDGALGRGSAAKGGGSAAPAPRAAAAAAGAGTGAAKPSVSPTPKAAAPKPPAAVASKPPAPIAPAPKAAAPQKTAPQPTAKPKAKFAVANADAPEFEISGAQEWNPDADSQAGQKK